jgi:hypothetical protein
MARWNEQTQGWEYAPGELEAQVEAALAGELREGEIEGLHIRYVQADGAYRVDLSNGVTIAFPARLVQGLAGRPHAELRSVHFLPDGDTIEWEELDLHLSLAGLMAGSFGNAIWNQAVALEARKKAAAHAGRATSPRKAVTSAENGKKGGRPRKGSTGTNQAQAPTPSEVRRRAPEGA